MADKNKLASFAIRRRLLLFFRYFSSIRRSRKQIKRRFSLLAGIVYWYEYSLFRRIKRFQKPVYYTLNASIFSDPLIILLDDAQARGHVALPTHDDWPITAVSLALSNLQWFVRYDLRIDYPFLGWPSM